MKYANDLAMSQAWHTAALVRTTPNKRFPPFKKFMGQKSTPKPEPQSVEQQARIIRTLHARLGGELTAKEGK